MKYLLFVFLTVLPQSCKTLQKNDSNVKAGEDSHYSKLSIPGAGAMIGASLAGGKPAEFNRKTGINHALFVEFFKYPKILISQGLRDHISRFVNSVIELKALPILTLEPVDGLDSYSKVQIEEIADYLNSFQYPIVLRWAHEMNGSWYPWGQQPSKYKAKFREFAEVIKQRAPRVSMAWAPNSAGGFPWQAKDIENFDKKDAYWQFYPGDDVVDIVGVSSYHWGWSKSDGKLGHNITPASNAWKGNGDTSKGVKNFHDIVSVPTRKPLFIFETAALFNSDERSGDSDRTIKESWIRQVYDPKTLKEDLPNIRAIMWFNVNKVENFDQRTNTVDWSLDSALDVYKSLVSDRFFIKSEELQELITQ